MKSTLTVISLCFLALTLSACHTPGLAELTSHLNERGCATRGTATASAGLAGASLGGNLTWDCAGRAPQTGEPEATSAPIPAGQPPF